MSVLFDVKTLDGNIIEGVYFIQYMRPIRGGKSNSILTWAYSDLECFKADGSGIPGIDLTETEFIRAYDEETGTDLTEYYKIFVDSTMSHRNPFVREVIKLEE